MILVTGGCGVMGNVLVRRLLQDGHRIRVLALPGDPAIHRLDGCNVEIVYGDIARADDLSGLCNGVTTVFHLAAIIISFDETAYAKINVDATRFLVAESERAGVRHIIYISSASVVYPMSTAYSRSKIMAEKIVRGSKIPYTIVRPTLVYDARGGQEFDAFIAYLDAFPIIPFIGSGKALKRPVFVGDIIDGLVKLVSNDIALQKTYNFSGAESISMIEFARLILKLSGHGRKMIVHLPVWFCRITARLMNWFMSEPPLRWPVIAGIIQDADLDPGEAIRDIGYNPKGVREYLSRFFPRKL